MAAVERQSVLYSLGRLQGCTVGQQKLLYSIALNALDREMAGKRENQSRVPW